MPLEPTLFFKCLGDETRLSLVLLLHREGELCVCEMTHALGVSQPKVSRHLASLRRCALLRDRREGQWIHYRLADDLPGWARGVLSAAAQCQASRLQRLLARLEAMGERPARCRALG